MSLLARFCLLLALAILAAKSSALQLSDLYQMYKPLSHLPGPDSAGYVPLEHNASIYYAFYESDAPATADTPVVLWLQGGPGCASLFGNFFELGPFVLDEDASLKRNPYAWNARAGLLFMDQPVGTGFSRPGALGIPTDEMTVAEDLYQALQGFFSQHDHLRQRPLFITGESYAGKYVPSIGHLILQMEQRGAASPRGNARPLRIRRPTSDRPLHPPVFQLAGLAIGDGLTDPLTQVETHADTAYYMGVIDSQQRMAARRMEREVASLIRKRHWREAHERREALLQYIQECSGVATLYDVRRWREYDAAGSVEKFVNRPDVKAALRAEPDVVFEGCSAAVGDAMGPDVMKSVKHLLPDILAHIPVLLYQGQFDLQDGVATSQAWISTLKWSGSRAFNNAQRRIWRLPVRALQAPRSGGLISFGEPHNAEPTRVAGYVKAAGPLTQVVITNAGHMLPHDQGEAAQKMLETWMDAALKYWRSS